jgi:hypothetical protein
MLVDRPFEDDKRNEKLRREGGRSAGGRVK